MMTNTKSKADSVSFKAVPVEAVVLISLKNLLLSKVLLISSIIRRILNICTNNIINSTLIRMI